MNSQRHERGVYYTRTRSNGETYMCMHFVCGDMINEKHEQ